MTHRPTAATTRRLLSELAAAPHADPYIGAEDETVARLQEATERIRSFLAAADRDDATAVSTAVLHQWRCDLDHCHTELERTAPRAWAHWRAPGTWLDCHLRLRSLIAHEVGKAYWSDHTDVRYDAIDIERYLWGAR